jgi:hypothetical protein
MFDDLVSKDQVRDSISALALLVSGISLLISYRMSQRTKAEKALNAWIELTRSTSEWWLGTLYVRNNSHIDIAIEKLGVEPPDFLIGDLTKAQIRDAPDGSGKTEVNLAADAQYLAGPFKLSVPAGETKDGKFMLYQAVYSRRKGTKVRVMYWTLEPRKRWCILPVAVKTRGDF